MNSNELRIALADCIKSFGGGKNNPQFFGVKFGSVESVAHFSHKYNPDVRLDVTLNSDCDGELDGRFIERDEILNFVETGCIDPEIRKDANVHLPEYRRNDYPLTWTFSKADVNFVKSYAGAVRANSYNRKFVRCATLHNYEGKIYLVLCEGHFLVARYLCEIDAMPCKLWGITIPVEFFEFLAKIKAKEYRVEFNFNEYGKFDSYVSCHSDDYTVRAILDLTVTMPKFASDIMTQKKIRYNYMPVNETIDFLKAVHLTGKSAEKDVIKITSCEAGVSFVGSLERKDYSTGCEYCDNVIRVVNRKMLLDGLTTMKNAGIDRFNYSTTVGSNLLRFYDDNEKVVVIIAMVVLE
ncbi:MAG: hypothetical protein II453_08975 [Alphaproteobacteria bacterium]|nr:hypothetical protein [Alphaproteobacteria bacterium]